MQACICPPCISILPTDLDNDGDEDIFLARRTGNAVLENLSCIREGPEEPVRCSGWSLEDAWTVENQTRNIVPRFSLHRLDDIDAKPGRVRNSKAATAFDQGARSISRLQMDNARVKKDVRTRLERLRQSRSLEIPVAEPLSPITASVKWARRIPTRGSDCIGLAQFLSGMRCPSGFRLSCGGRLRASMPPPIAKLKNSIR